MRSLLLVAATLLAACDKTTDPADDGIITWYGEVEPVVHRVCANCHAPNGIAPNDFTTYQGIRYYGADITEKLTSGEMPPPVSDPDCYPYAGSEHLNITDEERKLILDWVEGGTLEGDVANALPDFEPYFQHLEDADVELPLPEAHVVTPDESGNEYRCFVIDYSPEQLLNVTAFDVRVDNPQVVHHMLLFVDPNGDAGEGYGAPPGSTSFNCADPIMEDDWEPLHAWAPGMPPTILEDGYALKIQRGAQIVIQMHYNLHHEPGDEPVTDQSAYMLRTTTEAVREIQMFPGAIAGFMIPPGDPEYSYEESIGLEDLPFSIAVHGVFPHMHLLGTSYESKVIREDGSEQCIVAGNWDFRHQMSYIFDEPIILDPGDTLTGACTWDNSVDNPNQTSSPPKAVTWGEGTDDEMCVFLTYVSLAP